jgi:hypothetical protein
MPERPSIPPPRTVTGSKHPFDAEENSVGVLFTTLDPSAPDVVHLWLPLDKIVSTSGFHPFQLKQNIIADLLAPAGDSPFLPLHPLTARITTFIHTRPELAAPELLDRIQCDVWTYSNRTETTSRTERWKVSFSKKDGLVRFADERGPFWLGGKEVESYYCFS